MANDAPATEEKPATMDEKLSASLDKIIPEEKEEKEESVKSEAEDKPDEEAEKEEDKEGEEEKVEAKAETEEEEIEEEEEEDEELTPEFRQALANQRLDLKTLEDLSTKEKRVVLEQARKLNGAFTRVQMEAAAFRKEKAEVEVERSYRETHPDRFIADLLSKTPDLLDKVNGELKKRENPDYLEALEIRRAAEKATAEAQALNSATKDQDLSDRIATTEATTQKAAETAGLPLEFAQVAVANEILKRRAQGKDVTLTDAEISDIVGEQALVYTKHVGAHKSAATRKAKDEYVKEKAADAKGTRSNKPRPATVGTKKLGSDKKFESTEAFTNNWLDAQGM